MDSQVGAVSAIPPPLVDSGAGLVLTARQLIPGAYERDTLTHREPGAMGGSAFGVDGVPGGTSTMDAETTRQRGKEGGRLS